MKKEVCRLNKNDIVRGKLLDQLAEYFGESVLGVYRGKLRVEIIDEEGEVIQFSIAPTVHKTLVDEAECDKYIPIAKKIQIYQNK